MPYEVDPIKTKLWVEELEKSKLNSVLLKK